MKHLRNEKGAIDLASIMVGILVIGMIGGIIAATVFAIIPWTQDRAAKQQLDSVAVAQSAYKAKASSPTPQDGYVPNSYASSALLKETGLLAEGSNYCTLPQNGNEGYIAFAMSASGKVFSITNANTSPTLHTVTNDEIKLTGCNFLREGLPEEQTIMTYQCDYSSSGRLPFQNIKEGKLTVKEKNGNVTFEKEYANVPHTDLITLASNVEYEITFDGTYDAFRSQGAVGSESTEWAPLHPSCVRSLDHWGEKTGVKDASQAFLNASKLTSVPPSIPSTVKDLRMFFKNATSLNDPNVSSWDVSNINDLYATFAGASSFNQPLNDWNTSNVTFMGSTFSFAYSFNQPLNDWDVSNVESMQYMFEGANKFHQPLNNWDTNKVTDMSNMFFNASSFNQDIKNWNVSQVTLSSGFRTGSALTPENSPFG